MLRPCYLNQKQEEMFHRYCNSSATSLHDVYGSWSDNKENYYTVYTLVFHSNHKLTEGTFDLSIALGDSEYKILSVR